ncbi:bloom syndrome, partial [Favolaschia claudopus]
MAGGHAEQRVKSQRLLQEAREKARSKRQYDWEATRRDLTRLFEASFKKPPYDWQLDVAEALILGLDSVVIAGTGAGKTIPFMLPLLLHRDKFVLIISPLKVLQADQTTRFEAIGLAAAAVNGDTYTKEMKTHLDNQSLNAILTSPEMCFTHPDFRKWLKSEATTKRILAVIIDEAHCASQWGGDFRPHYAALDSLRTLLPVGIPVLATSATLNPQALNEVCSGLNIDRDESFFLNLGNDRPNITPRIVQMNSSKDYKAVEDEFPKPETVQSIADIKKSIVFTDAVKKTQVLCRRLRRRYPQLPRGAIDFLHAHRTAKAKRRIMKQFRKGKIKILVSTEAAGMGADIPDIELIIQFGVPKSLAIWTQRAGRAGRSGIQAEAVMLIEKSMFTRKRPRKGGTGKEKASEPEIGGHSDSDSSDDDDVEPVRTNVKKTKKPKAAKVDLNDGLVWGKNVDPIVREYISTAQCRRDVADEHFDNPPRRAPTGPCCDNCAESMDSDDGSSRPQTPVQSDSAPSSAQSTPSKHSNANGKRPMVRKRAKRGEGPTTRRGDHLKAARTALSDWRLKTYLAKYSTSPFTETGIMPDTVLTALASKRIQHVGEMQSLSPSWMLARRHGQEVILLLQRVDQVQREESENKAREKREVKRQQTQALQIAKKANKSRQNAATIRTRPALASNVNIVASTSASSPAYAQPNIFVSPHSPYLTPIPLRTTHYSYPYPSPTPHNYTSPFGPSFPPPIPHSTSDEEFPPSINPWLSPAPPVQNGTLYTTQWTPYRYYSPHNSHLYRP